MRVSGERVILATGEWTSPILRRSGIRAYGIVPGKGYGCTVPVERIVGMVEFDQ